MNDNIIAIDGYSYVGKSTIAQSLANQLDCVFINTGHMFRSVAKLSLKRKISATDVTRVTALAEDVQFNFVRSGKRCLTMVDGEDWTDVLDDVGIIEIASQIAKIAELRSVLVSKQRVFSKSEKIIVEGRDIGSVVFPEAKWKFFIKAGLDIRARRMGKVLRERSENLDMDVMKTKIQQLDEADLNRKIAPLTQAADAIVYDNSFSPTEDYDAFILKYYMMQTKEVVCNTENLKERL